MRQYLFNLLFIAIAGLSMLGLTYATAMSVSECPSRCIAEALTK